MTLGERLRRRREEGSGFMGLAAAGQFDAGLTAAATFLLQLYAVRQLGTAELGVLALAFSAMLLASQVPAHLVYTPVELLVVDYPASERMRFIRQSLARGIPLGTISALFVALGALPLVDDVDRSTFWALTVTAALAAIVSPVQDHVRRMLHLADDSWRAARTSAFHFVVTIVGAGGLHLTNPDLVPFGALVIANVASSLYGVWPSLRRTAAHFETSQVLRIGRWMLLIGISGTATVYLVSLIIGTLASASTLGQVEAARVLARPIQVLSLGLVAVTGPRSMEAGQRRDATAARTWRRRYLGLLLLVTLPYIALAAVPVDWNPLASLAPAAYSIQWLVVAMLVANVLHVLKLPEESELLGARQTPFVAGASAAAGALRTATAATVGLTGAFAAPLSLAVGGLSQATLYRLRTMKLYRGRGPNE